MAKIPTVTDEEWELVNEFNRDITKEFLQQGHLSPKTLGVYEGNLKIFFRWVMQNAKNASILELKPRHALQYQNWLIENGLAGKSIRLKRSAVSSLCSYIEVYYADEAKTFKNIFSRAVPNVANDNKKEKLPLTKSEYENLIKTLKSQKEWQILAYVLFSYTTGCRRAEAGQLLKEVCEYKTVEGKNYYVTHPIRCKGKGKEGKVRRLVFDQITMDALKYWVDMRDDDCPYMFVHIDSGGVNRVHETTFNWWCKHVISPIVGRNIFPHLLRSSRATIASEEDNIDIDKIRQLLGHESSETTKLYIKHDETDDMDDLFS